MQKLEYQTWELEQRLKALDEELDGWLNLTVNDVNYHRHHRQVESFVNLLRDIRAQVQPAADHPVEDAIDARERSKVVLGMFRIWEFLRGKLAQRREERFREYLPLADEYAWLCYRPIYDAGLKEPPLIYLNGGYSPYTLTRQAELQAESVPRELIRDRRLMAAMASLPFPVIGVPWYQVESLADLPVIGHEVGHSVEADLGLTGAIEAAVKGAVETARGGRWKPWCSELFADVYGCLGCGPAFVSSLASFLATEDAAFEHPDYPPNAVRFRFNLEVLRSLQYCAAADALSVRWSGSFPLKAAHAEFTACNSAVAGALLDGVSLGRTSLRNAIPFAPLHKRAERLAGEAIGLDAIEAGEDMRTLVAAYRLGFDQLAESSDKDSFNNMLERLVRLKNAMTGALQPDLRAGESPHPMQLDEDRRRESGRARAQFWLKELRK